MTSPSPPGPDDRHDAIDAMRLLRRGGEFRDRGLEMEFARDRFAEMLRQGGWMLAAAAILNTLFLVSDWRFAGTPHFWVAVPARLIVVAASLICLALVRRATSTRGAHRVMAGWVGITAACVAALVSSHSDLAFFVMLLLPMVMYLGVPLPFGWTVTGGVATSIMLLIGYEAGARSGGTMLGLGLALATLNICLALVVARTNRLRRLEWHAARSARAIADELANSREMLDRFFAASPVPMVVTRYDDGRILRANDSCSAMFGITPDMIDTASFQQFYADPEDRRRLTARLDRDGRVDDFETRARCADGKARAVMVKVSTIEISSGKALIAGIIDISSHKAVEMGLEWLASTDPLTKLPNRLSFFSSARAEMARSSRLALPLSLLMIDLDHFKSINDDYGHQAGDRALKAFGALCIDRLRGTHVVGRLGGEEFGLLLTETDIETAHGMAEDLRLALAAIRLPAPNETLRLSASMGLTRVLPTDKDLDTALARADRALYAAKRNGRNQVQRDVDDLPPPLLKAVN